MAKYFTGFFISILLQANFSWAYPECHNLLPDEGSLIESLNLKLVGLLYPNSFELNLKPEKECFFISNNYVKLDWQGEDIDGSIFEYGFKGWDGKNPQTCSLSRRTSLDKNERFTAWSNPLTKSDSVCSYVIRVRNLSKTETRTVTFVTMAATALSTLLIFSTLVSLFYLAL